MKQTSINMRFLLLQEQAPFVGCKLILYPYHAERISLPGLIQAEEASGFLDLTPGNAGEVFRLGDLDVYELGHVSGQPGTTVHKKYYVGDVNTHERLDYLVHIQHSKKYRFGLRYAHGTAVNGTTVTGPQSIKVSLGGVVILPTFTLPTLKRYDVDGASPSFGVVSYEVGLVLGLGLGLALGLGSGSGSGLVLALGSALGLRLGLALALASGLALFNSNNEPLTLDNITTG